MGHNSGAFYADDFRAGEYSCGCPLNPNDMTDLWAEQQLDLCILWYVEDHKLELFRPLPLDPE